MANEELHCLSWPCTTHTGHSWFLWFPAILLPHTGQHCPFISLLPFYHEQASNTPSFLQGPSCFPSPALYLVAFSEAEPKVDELEALALGTPQDVPRLEVGMDIALMVEECEGL